MHDAQELGKILGGLPQVLRRIGTEDLSEDRYRGR
jgi:hypothetical protein